ncbi:MAG: AlpA family phage regulatory protein [Planctomycetota bacterium]|jgi:predicted DNA-binding transcriptional regulator AlpA|nr:AlpA family phage regulatory protein [Planctomycetota bacterium]
MNTETKTPELPGSLLLDAASVARLMGIEKSFLYSLKSAGRLPPAIRLSRRAVRWKRDQVLRWIDAGCPAWEKMEK